MIKPNLKGSLLYATPSACRQDCTKMSTPDQNIAIPYTVRLGIVNTYCEPEGTGCNQIVIC
jgi:hypothetical protein